MSANNKASRQSIRNAQADPLDTASNAKVNASLRAALGGRLGKKLPTMPPAHAELNADLRRQAKRNTFTSDASEVAGAGKPEDGGQ